MKKTFYISSLKYSIKLEKNRVDIMTKYTFLDSIFGENVCDEGQGIC